MPIAKTEIFLLNNKHYINSLVAFINKLSEEQSSKKIILVLPSYLAADLVKTAFIKQIPLNIEGKAATFLPAIITIDQYIHHIKPQNAAGNILHYEQVLLMTSIIKTYPKIKYRALDAILIASQIVDIYWNLKRNNIAYDEIEKWVDEDLAEHWWLTAEFLKFCFDNYDKTTMNYTSKKIELEKLDDKIIVFACLVEVNEKILLGSDYGEGEKYIILPFIEPHTLSDINKYKEYNYLARNYQKIFETPTSIIVQAEQELTAPNYNNFLLEFYDIFEEAEYISHRIQKRKSSISIITENSFLKELIAQQLSLNNLEYNSSFGNPYLEFEEVELLFNLAKFKSDNGDIGSFISLLRTRILSNSTELEDFIKSLNKAGRFYENFAAVINDESIKVTPFINSVLLHLKNWLAFEGNKFITIFEENLRLFEIFYHLFELHSYKSNAEKFKSFVIDILQLGDQNYEIEIEEYGNYLYQIFSLKYSKPFNREADIYLLKPDDAFIIDTEEVIFADFNQDSYFANLDNNIWLSNKILKKLELLNEADFFDKLNYLVTSKLKRQDIYFTRSKYHEGVSLEKCSLLNFIKDIIELIPQVIITKLSLEDLTPINIESCQLPNILYATNIEQLIRDPYGFFAKKVLGIRKQKNVLSTPESSDFGIVVHALIEQKQKTPTLDAKIIIDELLAEGGYASFLKFSWQPRLIEIAKAIEELNKVTKIMGAKIYSEIEGSYKINLGERTFEIKAIADRIEVFPDKIRIIDFKSGFVPTKKDVTMGKSPQLVIEAIILANGGFPLAHNLKDYEIELVYIKVNSKPPYLDETIITITFEELESHKKALIELLEYYYNKDVLSVRPEYMPEFWRPTHDDYQHFRRI